MDSGDKYELFCKDYLRLTHIYSLSKRLYLLVSFRLNIFQFFAAKFSPF